MGEILFWIGLGLGLGFGLGLGLGFGLGLGLIIFFFTKCFDPKLTTWKVIRSTFQAIWSLLDPTFKVHFWISRVTLQPLTTPTLCPLVEHAPLSPTVPPLCP